MIALPDQQLQSEDWDCGRAALRAALSVYGRPLRLPDLSNPVQGTCPSTLEAIVRSLGLPAVSGNMRTDDLRHFTDLGRPVLCPIADHGGHWVVVVGTSGRAATVYYFDPSKGAASRRRSAWEAAWRDTDSKGTAYVNWGLVVG